MSEQKFQPGDRVAFLWEAMELHHGTVKTYHGGQGKQIYSVEDDQSYMGLPVTRFLYEHELTTEAEAKSANA